MSLNEHFYPAACLHARGLSARGSKTTMLPLSLSLSLSPSLTIELFVSGTLNSTTAAALSHPYPAGGGVAGLGWNI